MKNFTRSWSSARWIARQHKDMYVKQATAQHYRSRAAFKLMQLNQTYRLIRRGHRVLDLGCSPGGWSQVAARLAHSTPSHPLVCGVDLLAMEPIAGVHFIQGDFTLPATLSDIAAWKGQEKVHVVLSDMAHNLMGHRATDHDRSMELCHDVLTFSLQHLHPGGHLVMKFFNGGTEHLLRRQLQQHFFKVTVAKPDASRKESSEHYFVSFCKQ